MRFPPSAALLLSFLCTSSVARADEPPRELMARLAASAAPFEQLRKRASYSVEGHMDRLDGDGKVGSTELLRALVQSDGKRGHLIVLRYTKDGEDKTEKARRDAVDRETKSARDPDKDRLDNPLLEGAQPRYMFDVVERDPVDPSHVRISFAPKEPGKHTIEGSAWVDATHGTPLSASFRISRPGIFVDYIHVTLLFGAETPLGPSVSKVTMEANGGLLFFHKHVRGEALLSDYRLEK